MLPRLCLTRLGQFFDSLSPPSNSAAKYLRVTLARCLTIRPSLLEGQHDRRREGARGEGSVLIGVLSLATILHCHAHDRWQFTKRENDPPIHPADRRQSVHGLDRGPQWNRQGVDRPGHPPAKPPRGRSIGARGLHLHPRKPFCQPALRPRQGGVFRGRLRHAGLAFARPTAEPSSSTKSANSARNSKPSCCASSRNGP